MTAPWSPRPVSDSHPAPEPAPAAAPDHVPDTMSGVPSDPTAQDTTSVPTAQDVGGVLDELAVLDQLESDLTAVEQAIASLERVATEGLGGEDAATQIAAAVSVERFGGVTTTP